MTKQDLITQIIQLHWAVLNLLQTSTRPDWMELSMTMAQIKALFAISLGTGASINEVAEYLGVSQPTASQIVDKLVRGGLAARKESEKDRRIKLARLTEAGKDLVNRLYRGSEGPYRTRLSKMSEQDLLALHKGLQALLSTQPEKSIDRRRKKETRG